MKPYAFFFDLDAVLLSPCEASLAYASTIGYCLDSGLCFAWAEGKLNQHNLSARNTTLEQLYGRERYAGVYFVDQQNEKALKAILRGFDLNARNAFVFSDDEEVLAAASAVGAVPVYFGLPQFSAAPHGTPALHGWEDLAAFVRAIMLASELSA